MSKQTTVLLNDTASKIVDDYAQEHNCTRNRAINELIISHKPKDIDLKLNKIYSGVKKIYEKVNG